jgi:putative RNA 2'-phosphotransferase
MDPVRVSKTMTFLLRHRPDVGGLEPSPEGWVALDALCRAVSAQLRTSIGPAEVRAIIADGGRFELRGDEVRAGSGPRPAKKGPRPNTPEILYHATTEDEVRRVVAAGLLAAGEDKPVFLSADESHAWRVAHRLGGPPRVLIVDVTRARRHGVRFHRNRRSGLFLATPIPARDILNLLPGYAEQHSAGGFPVRPGPDGRPRVALIRVTRRSGSTWEVAKGKLEPGETPEATAVREVQEELGIDCHLRITKYLDTVRYGFMAPGGLPRLKSVFLYLMEPVEHVDRLSPRPSEGIGEVAWFEVEDAVRAVTHPSLQPVMRRLRDVLAAAPPAPG